MQKTRSVVQHIHFCAREARALGLELPEPETALANPHALTTALCAMLAHRADIDEIVEAWTKLKNGKRLNGAYRWQEYPLQLRRDLNSLLEEVRREKESGYWVVDDKARALCAIMRQKGKEVTAGRNVSREKKSRAASYP